MALTKVSRGLLSTGIVDNSTTTAITIDSSENVGIGTSSPSTKLHLGGTAPGDSIIRQDSTGSGTNWEIGEREAGKWQIFEDDSDSVVATFTSTGNVGIGTSSPSKGLHLNFSNDLAAIRFQNTANAKVWDLTPSIPDVANSGFSLHNVTDNTVPLHVDNSGNLLVGKTTTALTTAGVHLSPGGTFTGAFAVTANENAIFNNITTGTYYDFSFRTNNVTRGYIRVTDASVVLTSVSDPRLKTEFVEPENALAKIVEARESGAIGVYSFLSDPDVSVLGYNAHKLIDLQAGFGGYEGKGPREMELGIVYEPAVFDEEGVEVEPEKTVQAATVNPTARVPLLEAAIYDLLKMNEALTARIAALES